MTTSARHVLPRAGRRGTRGRLALRRPARDRGRRARPHAARSTQTGRPALETVAAEDGSRPLDRRSRSRGRLGRARGARPARRPLRRPRAAAAARRPRPGARALDRAGPRRRRLPGRRRADPRRRDRVGALPLPPRRRSHPPPRRAALLQAPRARARRRRERRSTTGSPTSRAPAPPAPSRTASPTRSACEEALGLVPTAELAPRPHDPARARADLEPPERHRRDLRRRRPRRRQQQLRGAHRARAPAERAPHRTSLPLRHGPRRRQRRSRSTRTQVGAAREELAAHRTRRALRGWRELLFNASFQDRLPDIGVVTADDAERLGAVGPAARAAGLAEDVRASSPTPRLRGLRAVVPERAAGDVQARLEQRALELWQSFELLDELLDRPIEPAVGRAERGRATDRRRPRREPARRDQLRRRARRRPDRTRCAFAPAPTRTGRSSPTPPPTTCSPTSR